MLDGGVLQVAGTGAAITLDKAAKINSTNGTIDTTDRDVSLNRSVSGVGQLIKSGSGKLIMTGDNTFEGGVRIKEGVLEVGEDKNLGKSGSEVLIDGATLAITGAGSATKPNTLTRTITLTENGGTVSVVSGEATLIGELQLDKSTGAVAADFTKSGAGVLNLTQDNAQSDFKGNTIIQEGVLGVNSINNLAEGKLFLDGGNIRTNAQINDFNKEVIINNTGGIDTNTFNTTVSGVIQGVGAFVKSGEGTLTLLGDKIYAGGTVVKGGVLAVTSHKNLGSVNTNITLDGGGLLIADHVDSNGQIDKKLKIRIND